MKTTKKLRPKDGDILKIVKNLHKTGKKYVGCYASYRHDTKKLKINDGIWLNFEDFKCEYTGKKETGYLLRKEKYGKVKG